MKHNTPQVDLQELMSQLVDELMDAETRGESVDIEELAKRHPEYASEILGTLRLLRSLDELDDSSLESTSNESETQLKQIGDFRLIRELGRGAMGVVYEAVQQTVDRRVAVKLLPFAALADPIRLQRFKNEVRAAGSLHHPHIVPVHQVGVERGLHYFAMQLINGPSAAELLETLRGSSTGRQSDLPTTPGFEESPSLPGAARETERDIQAVISTQRSRSPKEYQRTVARWGSQVAEAMAYAHQSGVLHRDIKPGNLLLDDHGNMWVADFGLARIEQDATLTMSGDILGTLRYMAPEQATAERVLVDHRADIYSLGATLYELLALRPVWEGASRDELLRKIATAAPTPLRQLENTVSPDLETIIHKALARSREDRFSSAQDFAEELNRIVKGQTICTRPPSLSKRVVSWIRNHPRISFSVIALTVTLLLVASVMVQQQRNTVQTVEKHLASARAFFESGNHAAAQSEITVARSRSEQLLLAQSAISGELATLTQRVNENERANARLARFDSQYEQVVGELHASTRYDMRNVNLQCRQALAEYDLPAADGLDAHPGFQLLSQNEQVRTTRRVLELLFLSAVSGIAQPLADDAAKREAHEEAVHTFSLLEDFTRPFPAAKLWMALSLDGLGRAEEAKSLRDQAAKLQSASYLEWLFLGGYQYAQRDYASAAESLENSLEIVPQSFLALMSYAAAMARMENNEDTNPGGSAQPIQEFKIEAICTGALAINPQSMAAHHMRAWARINIAQQQGNKRKQSQAFDDLEAARRIATTDYRIALTHAMFEGRIGNKEECLSAIENAKRLTPAPVPNVSYWHAHWLILDSNPDRRKDRNFLRLAIHSLTESLDRLPNMFQPNLGPFSDDHSSRPLVMRSNALLRRAWLRRELGNDEMACDDLAKVLEVPAHWEEQEFNVGLAQLLLGQMETSRNTFANLQLEEVSRPHVGEQLVFMTRALKSDDRLEFVTEMLKRLPVRLVADSVLGWEWGGLLNRHGLNLVREGNYEEAIPYYEQAIELNPTVHHPCYQLGQCYFQMGEYDSAIEWLTKAIELEPADVNSHGQRAFAYASVGDLDPAIADLDRLLSIQPSTVWGVRAVYQLKLGRMDDYQAAIQSDLKSIDGCFTWWFTLAPIDWEGMTNVAEVARDRLRKSQEKAGPLARNTLLLRKELGTVLYRQGKFKEAARELSAALTQLDGEDAMKLEERILAASFLSMAEAKRGDKAAADKWLAQAESWTANCEAKGWKRIRIELAVSEATSTLSLD